MSWPPPPLLARRTAVERHLTLLLGTLQGILPGTGSNLVMETEEFRGLSADLINRASRQKVGRRRGGDVPIVPLLPDEPEEISYWLGLHQRWVEDPRPNSQLLVYHTTGITVYFGRINDLEKVQLFRAEWPGLRLRSDGTTIFEAPGAGHPHWQFDAYHSRARQLDAERGRMAELSRTFNEMYEVEDFDSVLAEELAPEPLQRMNDCMSRLSRVHFASSTRWAQDPWDGDEQHLAMHASSPQDETEILNWVASTLIYVQRELLRL